MAIGNNGNILQHFVELEVARSLLGDAGASGLQCVFTHGMAPFEAFKEPLADNDPKTRVMARALRMSERLRKGLDPRVGQPKLFQAFADLEVGAGHYPNSVVLMDWLTRQRSVGLRATVAESNPEAQRRLEERWAGTEHDARVRILPQSWRKARDEGGLQLRGPAAWPWLFSMDPYTFDPAVSGPAVDPASVSAEDLSSIKPALARPLEAAPGVFAVFCYSMSTALRLKFQTVMRELAGGLPGSPAVVFIACRRDAHTAHVGALISREEPRLAALEKAAKRFFGTADYVGPVVV